MAPPQANFPPELETAWKALTEHVSRLDDFSIASALAEFPARCTEMRVDACGLTLDYSRHLLDAAVLGDLLALAEQAGVPAQRDALFAGEPINNTEQRAVMHMALRAAPNAPYAADGEPVMDKVTAVRERMLNFCAQLHSGDWAGAGGERITTVVNIGIGGSDLGPRMVCQALQPWHIDGLDVRFVSNVDPAALSIALADLDPASTLFIIASKTFTTAETMANAHAAREWLVGQLGEAAVSRHFVAVSTNAEGVAQFGIAPENMFRFWDWVGGRFSLWSAAGLSIVLQIGAESYCELLRGAADMDAHFRGAPLQDNLPVTLALLGVWYGNFLGRRAQVVVPYAQQLGDFVAWLQQLEMESNGKSVSRDGRSVRWETTPRLWGGVGTNAQHAFFQLLHQGPEWAPVDFILPVAGRVSGTQQDMLVANCIAQAAALMRGKSEQEVRKALAADGLSGGELEAAVPHRLFPGNRPSSLLLMPALDPYHLGALLAAYEHKVFVQGVIWRINSFDQWGVELGKQIATQVLRALHDGEVIDTDPATEATIAMCRELLYLQSEEP